MVLRDHAKQRRKTRGAGGVPGAVALTEIDFLLAVHDEARLGALRFRDEGGVCLRAAVPDRRTVPPLFELSLLLRSSRAVETQTETPADLAYPRGRGTSLGGLRPEGTVVDADGHFVTGKFPGLADERAVMKGEVLAPRLAQLAGVNAAKARLVDSDGAAVALVRLAPLRIARASGAGRRVFLGLRSQFVGGSVAGGMAEALRAGTGQGC